MHRYNVRLTSRGRFTAMVMCTVSARDIAAAARKLNLRIVPHSELEASMTWPKKLNHLNPDGQYILSLTVIDESEVVESAKEFHPILKYFIDANE